jgi:hypothetical protein
VTEVEADRKDNEKWASALRNACGWEDQNVGSLRSRNRMTNHLMVSNNYFLIHYSLFNPDLCEGATTVCDSMTEDEV